MGHKLFLLAAAGALGTLARYGCGVLVERHVTGVFPWPTLFVNMAGCFLFGLIYALSENQIHWEGEFRVVVLTGFMGAFTTYSAFAFQTGILMRDSMWFLVFANVAAHNVFGFLFLIVGVAAGRLI